MLRRINSRGKEGKKVEKDRKGLKGWKGGKGGKGWKGLKGGAPAIGARTAEHQGERFKDKGLLIYKGLLIEK